jgi:hypothetical protein
VRINGDLSEIEQSSLVIYACSGFKEPSETSHPLTVISIHSSTADESLNDSRKISSRISKRRKLALEKDPKLSSDDEILKKFLIKKGLIRARENSGTAMSRWKPKIELSRMSPLEIVRLSNDWRFLDDFQIFDTMKFRCEILAQKKALKTRDQKVLVKWFPPGIFEDCWIDKKNLPKDGIMSVKVQNMSWKQKLLIRDKLFVNR